MCNWLQPLGPAGLTGRGQLVETRLNEAFLSMLTCPTTLFAMPTPA